MLGCVWGVGLSGWVWVYTEVWDGSHGGLGRIAEGDGCGF